MRVEAPLVPASLQLTREQRRGARQFACAREDLCGDQRGVDTALTQRGVATAPTQYKKRGADEA